MNEPNENGAAFIIVAVTPEGGRRESWRVGAESAERLAALWRSEFPTHAVTIEPAEGRVPPGDPE